VPAESRSEHDVVVVGAGAAGCVIARRLVDSGLDVALVEAGPRDTHPAISDPGRAFELPNSELDWKFTTVEQQGCDGRIINCAAGRVLGGSSSINNTVFARGSRADFDGWAKLGNPGWSYDAVLPLFKRIEDFDGGASTVHGTGGPMPVMSDYERHPVMSAVVRAAEGAEIRRNPDYNAGVLDGVDFMHFNALNGRRQSAATAYLRPILGEPNLHLRTGTIATRLLIGRDRCTGVECVGEDGVKLEIKARHKVVLALGALSSPKLLLLSGVGPADDLIALGIKPRVPLAGVGMNLHDQVLVLNVREAKQPFPQALPGHTQYQAIAFTRSREDRPQPDLEYMAAHIPYVPGGGPSEGFTLLTILVQPASRGQLRLASAEPSAPALIDPGYLREHADVEALVSSLRIGRRIASEAALSEWVGDEILPGAAINSKKELVEYVRRTAGSFFHPVGTCRMGTDDHAVVDPTLAVRGVENLMVADASVMPTTTSANTHAPTLMIAERASDLISQEITS
jgi:choline dehydrogenase